MGRIRRCCTGSKISGSGARPDPSFWVLLSDCEARRHRDGGAVVTPHRQHPQLYPVSNDQPRNLAPDDGENLWSPIHAGKICRLSKGDGPATFTNPRIRRGVGPNDP